MLRIVIAREKLYLDYDPYKRNKHLNSVDIHFQSFNSAFNYYQDDGFDVNTKMKAAHKDCKNCRIVVNFFEIPININ